MRLDSSGLANRRLLIAGAAVFALGSAYLFGFVTRDQEFFPANQLQGAKSRIRDLLPGSREEGRRSYSIFSILLGLRVEETYLPIDRPGSGGGMTSVGDEVLLVVHDGSVFAVSGDEVRLTGIRVPDNGYEAYSLASQREPYNRLQHNLDAFRYNDVLYYSEGDQAGLVISYTEWFPDRECFGTTLSLLPLSVADDTIEEIERASATWEVIFTTRPCLPLKEQLHALEGQMAGGRIAYRSPYKLLLGSGDYHWDGVYAPAAYAQDASADYGKVVEVDLVEKTARHVALGFRNVQGLMVDHTGVIWAVEHGPRGGDELNRIEEGANYGWPESTLGTRYNHLPWPSEGRYGRHDGFTAPVFAWVPSVATSAIAEVAGFDPAWDGDILVGSLAGMSLFRLRLAEGRVLYSEPIPIGRRVRDVHQHTDGRIFVWTDGGMLITIRPNPTGYALTYARERIPGMNLPPDREARLRSVLDTCAQCHSFEPGMNEGTPSLSNILGEPIASRLFAGYSVALARLGGVWTRERLERFLTDPDGFAPGTTMPDPNLAPEAITDLITLFEALDAVE